MKELANLITDNIFNQSIIIPSKKKNIELFVSSQIKNSPSYIRLALKGFSFF